MKGMVIKLTVYKWSNIVIAFVFTLAALINFIVSKFTERKELKKKEDIASKIKTISGALNQSAKDLIEMQEALEKRIAFVEDLNAQAQKAERIASLNQEQVNAVNDILNASLKKEGRRNFWQGVLVNFIYFVLGAVTSFLIARFLK